MAPTAAQRDQASQWPRAEIEAAAGAGFMGMLIPDEHGGTDAGLLGYCIALEAISGADCGVGTIFHVHNISAAVWRWLSGKVDVARRVGRVPR